MFIFSLSIATRLRASKKEPSSPGDSCVTLSKPLYLPKSWLGPLQWGWHSFLLPPWLTNYCFCSHQDSSREGGEVTRRKVLTCSILSYKGPMPSGIKRCFKMAFYGFSRDPLPGYCTYKFVKFVKPPSSSPPHSYQLLVPRRLSTSGIPRTIFQPRVPQLDPGVLPLNIPSEDRVNSS